MFVFICALAKFLQLHFANVAKWLFAKLINICLLLSDSPFAFSDKA